MGYSTKNDLLNEFSYLDLAILSGDDTGALIDDSRINHAIDQADSIIRAYVYAKYNLDDIAAPGPLFTKLSLDITVYNLYLYHNSDSDLPSSVIRRYIDAIKTLQGIQKGEVNIDDLLDFNEPSLLIKTNNTATRYFDSDTLSRFTG